MSETYLQIGPYKVSVVDAQRALELMFRRDWQNQKMDAKRRGIEFELSFPEWLRFWVESGRLHQRGRKKGQYVMARTGDVGAYKLGNVRAALVEENHAEHWKRCGRREAMSALHKGKKHALGLKLGPRSKEFKENLSRKLTGRKYSSETLARMSAAAKIRYLNRQRNTKGQFC